MAQDPVPTRDRIIAAAARLFYAEGIRAVSVDAVAERAGITKKTLYYHFRSKDDLVEAYLQSRDQPALDAYAAWFERAEGDVAERIRTMFREFAQSADTDRWRGCGFLRTIAELANMPGHPAVKAGAAHKKRFEAWLTDIFDQNGLQEPASVARRIVILLDGAATVMLIHRDVAYVEVAGDVAAELVSRAVRKGREVSV
ncbi:MAG: helix-turn-helix domain-containing protein [Pseudomonadota bacterium]